MTFKHSPLIIPIEILVREFESRLLIALQAINNGFSVIFGEQENIRANMQNLPDGIYFDKSVAKNKYEYYKKLISLGNKIVGIDEEGLMAFNNTYSYLNNRHDHKNLNLIDKFFTWSNFEKELLCKYYGAFSNKYYTTGNARLDLWNTNNTNILYNEEIDEINHTNKEFILMPTNFAYPHIAGDEDFLKRQAINLGIINNPGEFYLWATKREYKKKCAQEFKKLILYLSGKNYNIVVRPHPSENVNYWKNSFNKSNILVSNKFNISSWIYCSKAVIHNSCTTGLEAYLQNKKVISYLPYTYNEDVNHISNIASEIANSKENVLRILNNEKINKIKLNDVVKMGNNYIEIVKQLNNLKFETVRNKIGDLISLESDAYGKQKFPNTETSYLESKYSRIKNIFNLKLNIYIKKLSNNIWLLKSEI